MGNHFCYVLSQDCLSHCFSLRYVPWRTDTVSQTTTSRTDKEFSRVCTKDLIRRNRISEYIAQALNRSRSPLLLHDDFLPSDSSPIDSDFPINNTNSWMSDATRSDASHRLYREVDPSYTRYRSFTASNNRMVDGNHLLTNSTSCDERQDDQVYRGEEASGGWVAVTRLASGSGKHTSTSAIYLPSASSLNAAVPPLMPIRHPHPPGHAHPLEATRQVLTDEEVDNLELARISRGLWDRDGRESFSRSGLQSTVNRPTGLNVASRSGPGMGYRQHSRHQQHWALTSPCPAICDTDNVSPVELDWDHEPGTTCARRNPRNWSGLWANSGSPTTLYLPSTPDDVGDASVPCNRNQTAARVGRPPLFLTKTIDPVYLSSPDALQTMHHHLNCHPTSGETVGPDNTGGLSSLCQPIDAVKPIDLPPDELVDSGFVGTSSCAGDSDTTLGIIAG